MRFDKRAAAGGVLAVTREDVDQGGWHADATPGRSSVSEALIIWRRVSCFHSGKPPTRHQSRRTGPSRQLRTHQPCVRPETLNKRLRDIRYLLETAGHALQPAQDRLATLNDLYTLTNTAGITPPTRIKTAS